HRAHRSGALQDARERDDRLCVGRRVDQVSVAVDPGARAPDADGVAERVPPLGAVVQRPAEAAAVDDQRQALTRERDLRTGYLTAVPGPDVDSSVAVRDHGREAVLQRLVHRPPDRRAVVTVVVDEAAVERREQAPALAERNLHRAPYGGARPLVA